MNELWLTVQKGGPAMYGLFFCSFLGIYITFQKLLFLQLNKINQALVIERIKNKLITAGVDQTLAELQTHKDIASRIFACAIKLSKMPREEIQEGIKEASFRELPRLEKNMSMLSSIITAAPMLGLLGTLLGLIRIFHVVSGGGLGDPALLSGGIAEALIATVTGLLIAIPFIFIYNLLSQKIDHFVMDIERMMNEILNFCRSSDGIKA